MLFSEHECRVLAEVEEYFMQDAPRVAAMLLNGEIRNSPFDLVIFACRLMPGIGDFVLAVVAQSLGLLLVCMTLLGICVPVARATARIVDDSSGDR